MTDPAPARSSEPKQSTVQDKQPEETPAQRKLRLKAERQRKWQEKEDEWYARHHKFLSDADVPTLAACWRAACSRLCYEDRTDRGLFVLHESLLRLAMAAKLHHVSSRDMLAMRANTMVLGGNVNAINYFFEHNADLAKLRTAAAIEIDELLVAFELQRAADELMAPPTVSVREASDATAAALDAAIHGPASTTRATGPSQESLDTVVFTDVEKAIMLLVRDGKHPRSMRVYAREVGISHSKLSRNSTWQTAWKAANAVDASFLPQGSKDAGGDLEAWTVEVCENCRQSPITSAVTVDEQMVRVCEACAARIGRTNRRTE